MTGPGIPEGLPGKTPPAEPDFIPPPGPVERPLKPAVIIPQRFIKDDLRLVKFLIFQRMRDMKL
jgi:hypothetical protein